jgi:environmental stress-induced protein Ves
MPWKNGKGETVEIAVFPPGASVDSFDWRISTATVAEDGPFSHFAHIDRTLSILTGVGMTLSVEGREPLLLQQSSQPYAFPGDASTTAVLTGGPITDLNVMTRRGRFRHRVTQISASGSMEIAPRAEMTMVLVVGNANMDSERLEAMDAVVLDPADAPITVHAEKGIALFLIEIDEAERS